MKKTLLCLVALGALSSCLGAGPDDVAIEEDSAGIQCPRECVDTGVMASGGGTGSTKDNACAEARAWARDGECGGPICQRACSCNYGCYAGRCGWSCVTPAVCEERVCGQ